MANIDITGLNKYELIARMYNHAKPQGIGFLHQLGSGIQGLVATAEMAQQVVENDNLDLADLDLEYIDGRYTCIRIVGNELHLAHLFDRYNGGEGTLAEIVQELRDETNAALNPVTIDQQNSPKGFSEGP